MKICYESPSYYNIPTTTKDSLRAGMLRPTSEISLCMGGMSVIYHFAFSPLLLLREKEQLLSWGKRGEEWHVSLTYFSSLSTFQIQLLAIPGVSHSQTFTWEGLWMLYATCYWVGKSNSRAQQWKTHCCHASKPHFPKPALWGLEVISLYYLPLLCLSSHKFPNPQPWILPFLLPYNWDISPVLKSWGFKYEI